MPRRQLKSEATAEQPTPVQLDAEGKPQLSADSLVAEYLRIKDYLATEAKRFAEFCKPHKDKQEALENQMLDMLNKLGGEQGQSIKTSHGTFFKTTIVTPKIAEGAREAYLDFILDHYDTVGNGMLQIGAPKKDAVDAYARENNGQLPPGVQISTFVNLNVRRA